MACHRVAGHRRLQYVEYWWTKRGSYCHIYVCSVPLMAWPHLAGPPTALVICWCCWWLGIVLTSLQRLQYVEYWWTKRGSYCHIYVCSVPLMAWLHLAGPPTALVICWCCWWLGIELTSHQQLHYVEYWWTKRGSYCHIYVCSVPLMAWPHLAGPPTALVICWCCWWLGIVLTSHQRLQYVEYWWTKRGSYCHIYVCSVPLMAWPHLAGPPTALVICWCCWWLGIVLTSHQQLQYVEYWWTKRGSYCHIYVCSVPLMAWPHLAGPPTALVICWCCWWLDIVSSGHRQLQYVKCRQTTREPYWHMHVYLCLWWPGST